MTNHADSGLPQIIDSTARIATWNVWANFGPWQTRYAAIEAELHRVNPDVVCLQEVWRDTSHDAAADLAHKLGYMHASAIAWFEPLKIESGAAILSRWPITKTDKVTIPAEARGSGALFQFAEIDGPRGPLLVFNAMFDWRPDLSHIRQRQVRSLCSWIVARRNRAAATILCGDFNAPPDSDEIRMLTGKSSVPEPGLVFFDAWEACAPPTPGFTWSRANRFIRSLPLPDRRIDYIFSAWGRPGGLGEPMHCDLFGVGDQATDPASDHYGLYTDLRY